MIIERTRRFLLPFLRIPTIRRVVQYVEGCSYLDYRVWDHEGGCRRVYEALMSNTPQAIGKLGGYELFAIKKCLRYGNSPSASELTSMDRQFLFTNAGVFPNDFYTFEKFSRFIAEKVLPEITQVVVSFFLGESRIVKRYCRDLAPIRFGSLSPYLWELPWTRALNQKRILVMHPFVKSIELQYPKRRQIWATSNSEVLPEFELDFVRVPLSPALLPPRHSSWFDELDFLKEEMDKKVFDIALVGAGAYSLPLVVHAKLMGKQGIHTGGETQFLFGIKGRRWDNSPMYNRFYNEYWVRPLPDETPPENIVIEDGCYW